MTTKRRRVHVGTPAQRPTAPGVALCRSHTGGIWPLVIVPLSLPVHPAVDCIRCLASLRVLRGGHHPIPQQGGAGAT